MKRILFVTSSLQGERGASSELGAELVERLKQRHPASTVTKLDLDRLALPHLDSAEFQAWTVSAAERDAAQSRLAARSDSLIDQLLSHDTLVLGVPMYNLAIPSALKAWIDRVVRAGKTFRYTADGPLGLAPDIDAYVVFARGGMYRDTPMDTQTGYIKAILGLIGIDNVKMVFAEGLAMGDDQRNRGLEAARDSIYTLAGPTDSEEVSYATA